MHRSRSPSRATIKRNDLKYNILITTIIICFLFITLSWLGQIQTISPQGLPAAFPANKRPEAPHAHDYDKFVYFTVELEDDLLAHEVAHHLGLEYLHQVGELTQHHLFRKPVLQEGVALPRHIVSQRVLDRASVFTNPPSPWKRLFRRDGHDPRLARGIKSVLLQEPKRRHRRGAIPHSHGILSYNATVFRELGIYDPGFVNQWHFHNTEGSHHDLNVTGLWSEGITGKGIVVAIVDDGIDFEHRDIRENYFKEGSFDFNKNRADPYPDTELDVHGTRCAGQVAGLRNDVCGVGIAFGAKVAGIRILSLPIADDAEAHAINFGYNINHVYSCSWGPPDDGLAMDRPPRIVEDAIQKGVEKGRDGKGTVFVFASGNGGIHHDNCNFDGYTNSIYSITVGAIDLDDNHPEYSEACSALMITAYSSGPYRRIYTSSSWDNACTSDHGGTSAAAPMVAGIIALALERRPDLTWRDFQHISVQSAVLVSARDNSWERTWAGRPYSMKFGFGRVDGYRFVHHALNFTNVGPQVFYDTPTVNVHHKIPQGDKGLTSVISVTSSDLAAARLRTLEHVTVTVDIQHDYRSDIVVDLISPNGIVSHLAVPRKNDNSMEGFPKWTFMTVKHWDEPAGGKWTLHVKDIRYNNLRGKFHSWQMRLWGVEYISSEPTSSIPVETPTSVIELPGPSEEPGLPDLDDVSKGYRITTFVVFILFISGSFLALVGGTFLYRRRFSERGYQQLQEIQDNDERSFVLDQVASNSSAQPPPEESSESNPPVGSQPSEVLFEIDYLSDSASQ
ncbi:pheromone processing endoprotease [Entomophthora muscae]|uniref:Pheromone processing endoprotease n=1 Tax=Entomophthora muscae TaxID=34485 RepID=A0ACC2RFC8_9FUNG|nr:pheromone processing endoprotease [Entomophthora muscae]